MAGLAPDLSEEKKRKTPLSPLGGRAEVKKERAKICLGRWVDYGEQRGVGWGVEVKRSR